MDIDNIRRDFPILSKKIYGKPLVYLDNAATTQKPECVVNAIVDAYYNVNANVHRGVHYLSQQATNRMEDARETVRKFIGAGSVDEVIFTRGTTESLNLLASSFTNAFIKKGDEIIISAMEHHSNIVPWQMQAERVGAKLKVIEINSRGELSMENFENILSDKTRIVSITHISNLLGTINPVLDIINIAHSRGVPVAIDGAQSIPHIKVDVSSIDADFFTFSGHKTYGPTGIGVLYGKRKYLDAMPPYQGGGEMIKSVSFQETTYNNPPFKFEAGTPDYISIIALAKALDYLSLIGMDNIEAYERDLCDYALNNLVKIPDLRLIGESDHRSGVISFLVGDIHPSDMGTLLDKLGIAVRTGHHCAEPLVSLLGVPGTVRASFGLYNTKQEIDTLCAGIERVRKMF